MKTNLLAGKRVAIVGGGPGGLTLARLLQNKGAAVTVYERDFDRNVRVQGATLDLHFGSGLKAIEEAGLLDMFKETYRPGANLGRVLDKQARILYDEHDNEPDVSDFGSEDFRPEIDRGDLRDLLLNALQPGTVVWNSQLSRLSEEGAGWRLDFKNGSSATADLVIGADGANSKIRPLLTPARPFYAGITILQGNVPGAETIAPGIYQLLRGGKLYVHSDEKYLHVSAKGDGSIDFYVSCKMAEDEARTLATGLADPQQLQAWFRQAFADWSAVWFELFDGADLPLLVRPQYCIPLDQTWNAQPGLTLLGDAAHIMPPSGEGVNLAMLDALELSECLTDAGFADLQSAIAAYETAMRARAAQEAQVSLDTAEWMHADGAQEKLMQLFG